MVRKVAFCVGCLAVRGLAYTLSLRPSQAVTSRGRLGCRKGLFHERRSHHAAAHPHNNGGRVPRCRRSAAGEEGEDTQGILLLDKIASPPTSSDYDSAATGEVVSAGSLLKEPPPEQPSTRTSSRLLLTGVVLACSVLLSSPLATTRPALADYSLQQQQQPQQQQQQQHQQQTQQQQLFGMVAPRPTQRPRPPLPEIPPGRITLLQWYTKNIGRYVPTIRGITSGVKTAAETAEKIRFKSGSSPTTQDLRRMAGDAVNEKLGGLAVARRPSSSAPVQEVGVTTGTSNVLPQSEPSNYRLEIDALKAEMLSLQPASPSTVGAVAVAPSETAAAAATVESRGESLRSSPFSFKAGERSTTPAWLVKLGMPPMPVTESSVGDKTKTKTSLTAAQTQQGATTSDWPEAAVAETPRNRGKKREKPRRKDPPPAAVVDLKAELRAESEKAAAKAPPSPQARTKQQGSGASDAAAEAVQYVAPAPLYEPTKELAGRLAGAGMSSGSASDTLDVTAGLEDVTAAAHASLEKLDLIGVSGQVQDLTEQTKDNSGSASEAGVAAALEKGRATLGRLQAEASRLSAEVGNTAAPIADKLSVGVSNLPEVSRSTGSSAGSHLSQFTAKLAASARSAAVQMGTVKDGVKGVTADLGSTAAGRLAEALGRGADKVLPAVGEAGRIVKGGASTLSKAAGGSLPVVQDQASALSSQIGSAVGGAGKTLNEGVSKLTENAADRLPAIQDQVSVLTSQVVDKSGQAVSQASDGAGKIFGRITGGLPGLAGRGADFTAQAKGTLGQLSKLGGGFADGALAAAQKALSTVRGISLGNSFSDGQGGVVGDVGAGTAAAAAVVVVAAGAAAVGRGGGGGGGTAGVREDAEVTSAGDIAGEGAAEGDERRPLQPIGGNAVGEGGETEGEGEKEGEGQLLQPVGVKLETGAANDGERFGKEALSASSTLWDMIRESGTGAGDAVREVSEEDLLERAALVGGQLRETAEGLEVLKHEVSELRESIRESDLEGKARAIQERLASILEGSIVD